ncbi:DUF2591 domain-containing protein [Pseudomonas capsici]|uniref:DUF2591 domain-containing protein n=1 Tax=Pseudomonas capsici TaxID=2810614 RepID=UPI0021F22592|nr:DUF2591 domain-containing protein [Pseudomonas capsici]MCV4343132.1 DUF2591 domain-containing protein [Pseudomonas capsici]
MIEAKTAELSGLALNWAVGLCMGWEYRRCRDLTCMGWYDGKQENFQCISWRPSTEWSQGGPLIEKYNVQTSYNGNGFSRSPTGKHWCAYVCKPSGQEELPSGSGPTPLTAACRAIVASKLGDTVQIPVELMPCA